MAKRKLQLVKTPLEESYEGEDRETDIDMAMVNAKPGTVAELLEKVTGVLCPLSYDADQIPGDSFNEVFTFGDMRVLRNILVSLHTSLEFGEKTGAPRGSRKRGAA
jgi:hypothetical protein